jgi:hypothetical protein
LLQGEDRFANIETTKAENGAPILAESARLSGMSGRDNEWSAVIIGYFMRSQKKARFYTKV